MENHTATTTGAGDSAAQILNNLTLAQAYAHAATDDKAAYIVELLGVKSIHSPLFVEMENAIEERFHQLRVADNRNGWHKVSAVRNSEKRKVASLLKIAEQCSALSCELEDFTRYYGEGFSILDKAHDLECIAWQKYHKKNEQFHS